MFNRFMNWMQGKRGQFRPAPHLEAVAQHNSFIWPNLAEAETQARVYQQSPWVYIAVNRIAEAAALVPLHIYRLAGNRSSDPGLEGEARRLEVPHHPLIALLDAPNPYISRFELLEQTVGMLELVGNAYWFLAGDAAGAPTEIWPLRPDRMRIVPDAVQYVKGYVYEIDGQRIPLDPVEVVHFKRWHPANDYYGLSALEAGRLAVSSDRAMAEWNRNTFGKDNGVPSGIVNVKEFVSDADFERIKREWRQSYGGPQRRTAFLRGGTVEWQHIGLSHSELDFLKGREAQRNEILNLFGLPVGLISENATEANATVAERLFIERTLWPKLVRLSQKITQDLLSFWPGDYTAEFEDIRPTDTQARIDEIRTACPVLSINEIRARYYRLPPVDWGTLPVGMEQEKPVIETQRNGGPIQPEEAALALPAPADNGVTTPAKTALDELAQWERFTIKRWGRSSSRAFEVRTLPAEIAFEVSAGLLGAGSAEEAQAVFEAARQVIAE